MEGAVVRGGAKSSDEPAIQAERRHPIADAFLGLGCRSMNRSAHLLERNATV
jgi:hypothetical protein